ncbi:peptidylprolyl isomerase [Chlorobaculum limnaeum]|uniref:Peptidylprolyl isomerase n=1 Tax=Chlorobaculum limnaeum TaxID=274537 RepID=A0A1D8D769_CHLLM|nr:peptidylprolyl isomerase [Chlorobaculum limnaeum]AOS84674.1 peptidylprolyl isomerase [Chlorobaculum limnaeum]
MKKVLFAVLALLMIAMNGYADASASTSLDRIAAIVGNEIILDSDIREQELMLRLQYPDAKNDPQLRKKILDNMVTQKIILTKAKIDTVKVDEKSVEEQAAARYNSLRANFPSVQAMESRFGLPVNRLKQNIRDDIRNQQMIDAFRRKHFREVNVSYDETMAFYQQERGRLPEAPETVSVSQLIKMPLVADAARVEALDKIKAVQQQLAAGGNFADLARAYSDDPGSRQKGGDLGFTRKGELVPSFEQAASDLKPGQISGIVESRFGYHIIQLIGKAGERMHTRHILAMFDRSKTDAPATIALLKSIREEVLSGKTTFAAMAEKYSDDPATAANGGLISSGGRSGLEVAGLRPELQKIITGLKNKGDISQPEKIQPENSAPFYALFMLNSREPAHALTLERDFARIEELAMNRKSQEQFNAWIESLKKEVMVQVMSDI